jgi:hypothetical protein
MKKFPLLLAIFILVFLTSFVPTYKSDAEAKGTTYYVSMDGKNSNPGTREAPWSSPGYASRRLKPGDTLVILGGRYVLRQFDEDIVKPPSGQKEAWITIRGEEKDPPVLAGRDDLAMAVDLSGRRYVRLENIEITHDDKAEGEARYFRDGLVILEQPADHIVLKNLYIHHLDEFGLNLQDVDDLKVIGCRIEYAGFGAIGGPRGVQGGLKNLHIEGCRLAYSGHYYQGENGSNRPYDRPDGFGIEPSRGPVEILETVAEHNRGDGLDSKADRTVIRRSIAANNSCDGVKLWGTDSIVENTLIYGRGDGNREETPWSAIVIKTKQKDALFKFINVTVDDKLGGNYLMHVQYDYPNIPVRLVIQNSIFRGTGPNSPIFVGEASKIVATHNLIFLPKSEELFIHGEKEYSTSTIRDLGKGIIHGDPLFLAPAWGKKGNYRLQDGSPAIDAGTPKGAPSVDLEGVGRVGRPDLGAYEHTREKQ